MTRTEDALLAAVIAAPADDLPRLAFADFCGEQGDDARAEFIRCQIELARAGRVALPGGTAGMRAGCPGDDRRGRALRRRHGEAWGRAWPGLLRPLRASVPGGGFTAVDERQAGRLLCGQGPLSVELRWRRGFLAEVTLPCAAWLARGPALVRAAPLEVVTFSDRTPTPVDGERGRYHWWHGDVPAEVYRLMACDDAQPVATRERPNWKRYHDLAAARAALSLAALSWAGAAAVAARAAAGV